MSSSFRSYPSTLPALPSLRRTGYEFDRAPELCLWDESATAAGTRVANALLERERGEAAAVLDVFGGGPDHCFSPFAFLIASTFAFSASCAS